MRWEVHVRITVFTGNSSCIDREGIEYIGGRHLAITRRQFQVGMRNMDLANNVTIISLFPFWADCEWLPAVQMYSRIEPSFGQFVPQDREVIVGHFTLFVGKVQLVKQRQELNSLGLLYDSPIP